MTDVDAGMSREPHPFVNAQYMSRMEGQTVDICGKVDKVEAGSFTIRSSDGKSISQSHTSSFSSHLLKIAALLTSRIFVL